MTEPTHLIRRDLPLEPGRTLVFSFTVAFEVTIDENCLDYEQLVPGDPCEALAPTTLDELERFLGDTHRSSDSIWRALANNYDRTIVEHEVTLDDRYTGADEGDIRFEAPWEATERESNRETNWLSRVWLDEVPSAGALPLGPESNPPIPADEVRLLVDVHGNVMGRIDAENVTVVDHPTAAEVMEREG